MDGERRLEIEAILEVGRAVWTGSIHDGSPGAIEPLSRDCLDWTFFLDQASRHRMMGACWLLLSRVHAAGTYVPHTELYGTCYKATVHRNRLTYREIRRILPALRSAGVDVVLRKGAVLVEQVYRDTGLRPMKDVDVLVRPGHEKPFMDTMRQLGYQAGQPSEDGSTIIPNSRRTELAWRLQSASFPSLHLLTGDTLRPMVTVDPCRALFLPKSGYSIAPEELFEAAVTVSTEALGELPVLAPHHLVLDLCAHLYKESTTLRYMHRGKYQRLTQYVDIIGYFVSTAPFDWDGLLSECARHGVWAPVYFALANARSLYPDAPVPADVVEQIRRAGRIADGFLDEYGHVDLSEPRRWRENFMQRTFSPTRPALPASASLI
jgi:hypothetical protein